jgi:hypothetical protein
VQVDLGLLSRHQISVFRAQVNVFTTKMGVTIIRSDLEHSLLHLQNEDIESASSYSVMTVGTVQTASTSSGEILMHSGAGLPFIGHEYWTRALSS